MAAASGGLISVILAVVVIAVSISIGVVVFAQVSQNLPTLSGQANTTAVAIQNQTYSALQLAPILLIVLIAGAIIGALLIFARWLRMPKLQTKDPL